MLEYFSLLHFPLLWFPHTPKSNSITWCRTTPQWGVNFCCALFFLFLSGHTHRTFSARESSVESCKIISRWCQHSTERKRKTFYLAGSCCRWWRFSSAYDDRKNKFSTYPKESTGWYTSSTTKKHSQKKTKKKEKKTWLKSNEGAAVLPRLHRPYVLLVCGSIKPKSCLCFNFFFSTSHAQEETAILVCCVYECVRGNLWKLYFLLLCCRKLNAEENCEIFAESFRQYLVYGWGERAPGTWISVFYSSIFILSRTFDKLWMRFLCVVSIARGYHFGLVSVMYRSFSFSKCGEHSRKTERKFPIFLIPLREQHWTIVFLSPPEQLPNDHQFDAHDLYHLHLPPSFFSARLDDKVGYKTGRATIKIEELKSFSVCLYRGIISLDEFWIRKCESSSSVEFSTALWHWGEERLIFFCNDNVGPRSLAKKTRRH